MSEIYTIFKNQRIAEILEREYGTAYNLVTTFDSKNDIGLSAEELEFAVAVIECSRELMYHTNDVKNNGYAITCPSDIFNYIKKFIIPSIPADQEELWCILLDTRNVVIGRKRIYIGTVNQCCIDIRDIAKFALSSKKCASVILAHNHPSGNTTPSFEDRSITEKAMGVMKNLGYSVMDHIVFTEVAFKSIVETMNMFS